MEKVLRSVKKAVFDAPLPHANTSLFLRGLAHQGRLRLLLLEISGYRRRFANYNAVIEFEKRHCAGRIQFTKFLAAVLSVKDVNLDAIDIDALLGEEDVYTARVHRALAIIQFHLGAP